jgi:DNA-binding response OmpR family regulator
VLVISADATLCEDVSRLLGLRGFRPVGASDVEEAAELCRRERPVLIIADLRRSPLDDLASARLLRTRSGLSGIPLLIISPEEARGPVKRSRAGAAVDMDYEELLPVIGLLTTQTPTRKHGG